MSGQLVVSPSITKPSATGPLATLELAHLELLALEEDSQTNELQSKESDSIVISVDKLGDPKSEIVSKELGSRKENSHGTSSATNNEIAERGHVSSSNDLANPELAAISPTVSIQKQSILAFLEKAVATGKTLDRPEERRQAQGLIDYWVANLYSLDPHGARRLNLREMILASFDQKIIDQVVNRAKQMSLSLDFEQQQYLRDILLRMVRFDHSSREFTLHTVSRDDLESVGPPDQVNRLLEALMDAGVLRGAYDEKQNDPSIRLSHEALIRKLPVLESALERRIKLAEATDFWRNTNRDKGLLMTSCELIDDVRRYHDLSDWERRFIDESSRAQERADRFRMQFFSASALVLGIVAFVCTWLAISRNSALNEMSNVNIKLEDANERLDTRNEELTKALVSSEENAQLARDKLSEAQVQKEKADKAIATCQSFVEELLNAKATATDLEVLKRRAGEVQNKYLKEFSEVKRYQTAELSGFVQPGTSAWSGDGRIQTTTSVFLTDNKGQPFLLAPAIATSLTDSGKLQLISKSGKFYANFNHKLSKGQNLSDLITASIEPNIPISNKLSDGTKINDWVRHPRVGMMVRGYGATSGASANVPILEIREDGTIVTKRISSPGDAGGPVIDSSGNLVGLIIGSNGRDETHIKAVNTYFEKSDMKIMKSN